MYDLWVYQALVKAFAFLPWKTQFLHPFQGIWFNSVQKSRITQTGKEVQERTQSFHQNFKLTILLSLFAICNVGISAHASLLATSDVPILFFCTLSRLPECSQWENPVLSLGANWNYSGDASQYEPTEGLGVRDTEYIGCIITLSFVSSTKDSGV